MTHLLQSLKRSVRVEAFVTRGSPLLDSFVDALRALLAAYKTAAPQGLEFSILETKDEPTKARARAAGLVEQPFTGASELAALGPGFMGLVVRYGDAESVYKFLPPDLTHQLPFLIGGRIYEVRDKADDVHHKIGVLAGHDEIRLTEANMVPAGMGTFSIQGIIEKNFTDYVFEGVDLKGGDAAIDDDLEGLIITQPGVDLTEKELRRIDQFVMKGKALAVFASAVNVKAGDTTMQARLSTHGLETLLGGYGIGVEKDVVIDLQRPVRVVVKTSSGTASVDLPQILHVESSSSVSPGERRMDTSFPPFFRVDEVAVPFASSLTLQPARQPKARMRVVLRSSTSAFRLSGDSASLALFQHWADQINPPVGQFVIAAEVGGTLVTAFPEGGARAVDAPVQSAKTARVFVLSSSQFLANPLARAGNPPEANPTGRGDQVLLTLSGAYAQADVTGTILAFKNTLDWLSGDGDLLTCSGTF
jgi:hypothetical protein